MVYAGRWRKCAGCPTWFWGRLPSYGKVWCVTCRIKNAADSARQLANRSGPYYDKWLGSRGPRGRPRNNH